MNAPALARVAFDAALVLADRKLEIVGPVRDALIDAALTRLDIGRLLTDSAPREARPLFERALDLIRLARNLDVNDSETARFESITLTDLAAWHLKMNDRPR